MDRLSPVDKNFWNLETTSTRQVIGSLTFHDRAVNRESVIAALLDILPLYPRFHCRVAGYLFPKFVPDKKFDIENHVIRKTLPPRLNRRAALDAVGKEFSIPLDYKRSPWKFVIFDSPKTEDSPGTHATLFCFHHSMVDGMGAIRVINSLAEASARLPKSPRVQNPASPMSTEAAREPHPSSLRKVLKYARLKRPTDILSGPNSSERRVAVKSFPANALRELKRRGPFTPNDILLTAVARGVAHFAERLPPGFPAADEIRIIMPVSLRRKETLDSLGNQLTAIAIPLPVTLTDPIAHLKAVSLTTQTLKDEEAIEAYSYLARFNSKFPPFLQRKLCERQAKRTNFICTNMVHSGVPLRYGESVIQEHYGLPALLHEQGVAFSFITYMQQICVSVVSDAQVLADPRILLDCFFEGLEDLLDKRRAPAVASSGE